MDQDDHEGDPFSSEGLWRLSKFTLLTLQPLEPLPWNKELPDLTSDLFKNPLKLFDDNDSSSLRQLNVFLDDPFETDPSHDSTTDTASEGQFDAGVDTFVHTTDELEDLWSLDQLNDRPDHRPPLRSWEHYEDRSFREPVSAYFSDSGAKGFDAALAHQAQKGEPKNCGRIVRNGVFFRSLIRLGLGWDSIFFRYNDQKKVFEKVLNDVRISGVSVPATNNLIEEILQCGKSMQRIRSFALSTPPKSDGLAALHTFSGAAATIVYTLEKHLLRYSDDAESLLQIKTLFQQPGELVGALADIIEIVEGATSDAEIISTVFGRAAYFSQRFVWMEKLLYEIAVCVAKPWLRFVESWIGLRSDTLELIDQVGDGRSFAVLERSEDNGKLKLDPPRIDYTYRPDQVPSFIPSDQAKRIFESGRSLRLLKRSHPQHPIAHRTILRQADPPNLHCAITWTDIERIQGRAHEYEAKLRAEILKYNSGKVPGQETQIEPTQECFGQGSKELANTFELFDPDDESRVTGLLATPGVMEERKLSQILEESEGSNCGLSASNFGPELASTLYLSLAPVISSQAILIDFSCLHLLFKEHRIRYHLTLQWRFQLLGEGYFATRLSHSLFDPEMRSGERKSGAVRSGVHTGLRLGSRDTWPPASSELRLVLIGLLNECYSASDDLRDSESIEANKEKELPGGLSFAIRELTEEEIVKCKDPNAIEALDFLRLQYKPPAVLETIITQRSLNKYDRLFKHLLRLLRMVSVANSLIRDSTARNSLSGDTRNVFQKFRIDSQCFILAVCDYSFHVAVGSTWQQLQETLSRIEHCLDRGDIDGTIEAAHSVPRLRDYHEDILDRMLFALLLSKRHAQASKLLENIFRTILSFAPLSRVDGTSGVRRGSEGTVQQLYTIFRKQASTFVGYLRSLDGGKGASKSLGRSSASFSSRAESASVFDHLLIRLDVKQYY
ncbi:gamma-tubulin complex component GCP6 [Aspergillus sclerotialis]|uniref:Spindle pole body component n=1 Tax=Aspergillus sclerotialis TaxID=2070753 RepID=A0A3A2ZH45_9EURO|nr:gamma-tubulin complex component GCP6 [Aspergillus sclerotialis]